LAFIEFLKLYLLHLERIHVIIYHEQIHINAEVKPLNIIQLTYKSTNCFLIAANDGWLMIDAGWPDTLSQLLHLLSQNDISVNEINYLIVTHFHPDHAGLTQNLKDLGIHLILLEGQVPYVSKMNQYFRKSPKENFKDITSSNTIILPDSESRSFFESIGIDGDLISTPGHSDDSVSLVIDKYCAFIGDLPAYSMMKAYDDSFIEGSWDLIKNFRVRTIYPGHGEPYDID
jgi:glyoxylase-like metal-dependent hydrolase (beta-lactamase superfamily II)